MLTLEIKYRGKSYTSENEYLAEILSRDLKFKGAERTAVKMYVTSIFTNPDMINNMSVCELHKNISGAISRIGFSSVQNNYEYLVENIEILKHHEQHR